LDYLPFQSKANLLLSLALTQRHHHMGVPIMKEVNETMAEDLVEPHKCTTHL